MSLIVVKSASVYSSTTEEGENDDASLTSVDQVSIIEIIDEYTDKSHYKLRPCQFYAENLSDIHSNNLKDQSFDSDDATQEEDTLVPVLNSPLCKPATSTKPPLPLSTLHPGKPPLPVAGVGYKTIHRASSLSSLKRESTRFNNNSSSSHSMTQLSSLPSIRSLNMDGRELTPNHAPSTPCRKSTITENTSKHASVGMKMKDIYTTIKQKHDSVSQDVFRQRTRIETISDPVILSPLTASANTAIPLTKIDGLTSTPCKKPIVSNKNIAVKNSPSTTCTPLSWMEKLKLGKLKRFVSSRKETSRSTAAATAKIISAPMNVTSSYTATTTSLSQFARQNRTTAPHGKSTEHSVVSEHSQMNVDATKITRTTTTTRTVTETTPLSSTPARETSVIQQRSSTSISLGRQEVKRRSSLPSFFKHKRAAGSDSWISSREVAAEQLRIGLRLDALKTVGEDGDNKMDFEEWLSRL